MNCTACGSVNAPGTRYCGNCGRALGEQGGAPAPGTGAPVPPPQPTPPPEQPQQPPQPQPQPPAEPAAPEQYDPYAQPQQPAQPAAPEQYGQYGQTEPQPPGPSGEYPPPGYAPPEQHDQYGQPQPPQPGQPPQPTPSGGYPPGYAQQPGFPPGPGGPSGPYGAYPPGGQPPPKKKRRGLFLALALIVIVAIGAGTFVVLNRDDDTGAGVGSQVVLEPVSTVRPDGFTDEDLDVEGIGADVGDALAGVPQLGEDLVASLAGLSTGGTEAGLYGGTQDTQTCDVEQLVTFLTSDENADKAAAWADTLGIEVGDIPDYVAGLTAVRLRFDTRVTNHGFADGEANAFQSILQAGTAVLVDDEGIPRVKCNCGNPLLEPEQLGGDLSEDEQVQALDIQQVAENPQDAWEGLDPANVVSITPGEQVTVFILVSPEGRLFKRPVGSVGGEDERIEDVEEIGDLCDTFGESPTCVETSLGSGDVQATLRWSSSADLDLHVLEPDGTEISYSAPGPTASGGKLDVDSNVNCVPESGVENVFWPPGGAPSGDYVISVHGFSVGDNCGSGDYELTIKVSGQEDQVISDSVGPDETDEYPVTFDG